MHTSIPSFAIILDTVVKSTLLLAIAWGATLILKKRSAATQHMVRTFALAALLLLPFAVMLLPAWHIKGLPQYPRSRSTQQPAVRQAAIQASLLIPREAPAAPAKGAAVSTSTARLNARVKTEAHSAGDRKDLPATSVKTSAPAVISFPVSAETVSAGHTTSTASLAQSIPQYLPRLLLGLWIAGALFFLARWRLNAMRLAALVRRASVLTDSGWNAQVRALCADLGINRHVALLVSDEIEIPITTGIMFPRIVLSRRLPRMVAHPALCHPQSRTGSHQTAGCVHTGAGECGSFVVLVSSAGVAHGAGHARGARARLR